MSTKETSQVDLEPGQISYEQFKHLLGLLLEGYAASYLMNSSRGTEVVGDWYEPVQLVLDSTTAPTLKRELEAAVMEASKVYLAKLDAEVRKIVPDMPAVHEGTVQTLAFNIDLSRLRRNVRRQP